MICSKMIRQDIPSLSNQKTIQDEFQHKELPGLFPTYYTILATFASLNKYPRVQQMRPRAHFRRLNTFKHIYTLLNTFFDLKKKQLKKKNFYFKKFITRKLLDLERSSLHQKV